MTMKPQQAVRQKQINGAIKRFLALLFPVTLVIITSWAADFIKGDPLFEWLLHNDANLQALTLLIMAGIAISITEWLYKNRRIYQPVRMLSKRRTHPKPCLIMLVSNPNPLTRFTPDDVFPIEITPRTGSPYSLNKGLPLRNAVNALDSACIRWNWEQLLRGVLAHQSKRLKRIHLIGSEGEKGSHLYLPQCRAMVEHYTSAKVTTHADGIDFENLEQLVDGLQRTIEQIKAEGLNESDICIDATGGQKTTSISAALVTLTSQVTFQYVQTGKDKQVISYDVVSAFDPPLAI